MEQKPLQAVKLYVVNFSCALHYTQNILQVSSLNQWMTLEGRPDSADSELISKKTKTSVPIYQEKSLSFWDTGLILWLTEYGL